MSHKNGAGLKLTGTGAAYIRVSTEQQDTERQYAAVSAFEQHYGVSIPKQYWFKDEGWARDEADRRPDFQRLMKLAESGRVQWIVVDQLDRFGTKNAKQLISYLHRLEEAACKLYDITGREWTGEDIGTTITAVVEGEKSKGEQTSKSHRVLGAKIANARAGEWQGGPLRLGFDVVCFHRETDKELWRVVFEGRSKRLKVHPDGRTERFDGKDNFPKFQPVTEVLRVAPSNDKAKIDAAVSVFKRYATESIGFTELAHYLSKAGWRNGCGGYFQHAQIEEMLSDSVYLGYYTYNKWHFGKFNRYANGQTVPELNYAEKGSKNDVADWVHSRRLFEPLVDLTTWDAVQRKLGKRSKRDYTPRSASQYLAGLVYCGNCSCRMVAGPIRKTKSNPRKDGHSGNERHEYFCGSYFKAVREKRREECKCLRNGVFQDTLEEYVERYLEEAGRRLEIMADGLEPTAVTDQLAEQHEKHWWEYQFGLEDLKCYLMANKPDEYRAMLRDSHTADATPFEFLDACITCYRSHFDSSKLEDDIERLEAEHSALMQQWSDLPTPLAKEKAKEQFAELEARIGKLRRRQVDLGKVVSNHYQEMIHLQDAIATAERSMKSVNDERALRQRAEALRTIIQRIECTFTATGEKGGGWGKKNARLTKVTIYPVVGDSAEFSVDPKGTLMYSSAQTLEDCNALSVLLKITYHVSEQISRPASSGEKGKSKKK